MGLTDRLEDAARGVRRPRLAPRLIEAVLIAASCLLLGIMLYEAQFSGQVRWLLGLALVAAVVLWAWSRVSAGTEEPAPLSPDGPAGELRAGELASLTASVQRAETGLEYSQFVVFARARDAFAERVRRALGLTAEAAAALAADAEALRLRVHDAALEDVLYRNSTSPEARERWVRQARARDGFSASLERALDRMEAWR